MMGQLRFVLVCIWSKMARASSCCSISFVTACDSGAIYVMGNSIVYSRYSLAMDVFSYLGHFGMIALFIYNFLRSRNTLKAHDFDLCMPLLVQVASCLVIFTSKLMCAVFCLYILMVAFHLCPMCMDVKDGCHFVGSTLLFLRSNVSRRRLIMIMSSFSGDFLEIDRTS